LYVYFIQNALGKYGQKLSDLVNSCKIDTKKQGKSYVEQRAYMDKYNQLFDNEDGMFEDEGLTALKNDSYVDKKTKNAVDLYERILSQFSIQSTATFKDAHDKILERLNSSSQNKTLSKKVTTAIMTWLKSKFFEEYVSQRGDGYYNSLFYGDKTIQARLIKIQNEIKRDKTGKFSKFGEDGGITLGENGTITNPLLKALQPDVYETTKGFDSPQFIKLENALLDDSDNANALERAWDELYRDEEHYYDDEDGTRHYYIKEFAEDLAIYAFLTSGDKNGTTKFFKYVPNTIRTALSIKVDNQDVSYAQYIRRLQDQFTNGEYDFSDADIDSIIEQNWQDNDFVKQIKMTVKRKGKRIQAHTSFGTITSKSQQTVSYKKKSGKVGFRKETLVKTVHLLIGGVKKTQKGFEETIHRCNDDKYPSYIKMRRPTATKYDADNYLLYKFREFKAVDPTDPNSVTYPIYELVSPAVATIRAGSYDYQIFNFGEKSPAYPLEMQEIMQKLREDVLTTETDMNDALKEFVNALNDMGVALSEEELEDVLEREFEERDFEYTKEQLDAAIKWVKSKMAVSEEGGKAGNRGKKKSKKTEKKTKQVEQKVTVGDVFGEDEEIKINKPESSEESAEQQPTTISDDIFDDDDEFLDEAMNICKNRPE